MNFKKWFESHTFANIESNLKELAYQIKMFLSNSNIKTTVVGEKVMIYGGTNTIIVNTHKSLDGSFLYHVENEQGKLLNIFNSDNKIEMLKFLKTYF